jgi:predicted GNAT superfamily acetyltransferase
MLAVREQWRDRGIGKALKDFQREELLRQGIHVMYWTYDPLVARNARLNIRKLGVEVVEYVRDMYGVDEASVTDSVIGSDRFVVRWNLEPPDGNSGATWGIAGTEEDASSAPLAPLVVAAVDASGKTTAVEESLQQPAVRVEIPTDIQALKLAMPEVARSWRATTRRVFESYLGRGYGVAGFYSEADSQRCFYYLVLRSRQADGRAGRRAGGPTGGR